MKYKTINFFGFKISHQNFKEAAIIFKDIFIRKEYHFETEKKSPFILDCGSHIGLSILYFKKVYPKAKIIAFEANPNTCQLLKQNVTQNNLKDVRIISAALFDKKGEETLYVSSEGKTPWAWGDAIVRNKWNEPQKSKKNKVKTEKLSGYMNRTIDFLKLDIEGAETRVLKEIESKLPQVNEMVMEFHGSSTNKENNLEKVLQVLKNSGFNYTIKQKGKLIKAREVQKTDPFWLIIHAKRTK